ncbi:hypothetical protein NW768_010126 [Fusarium equiseti]|uniref:Uncharacterized protein n=1 Tax=Fusarium equiseti TaxID=61235 RepID=A0ABQ8R0X1_FUSEQ|nr:hypothetical protein NW768_010126 [Fusarium equiseti]
MAIRRISTIESSESTAATFLVLEGSLFVEDRFGLDRHHRANDSFGRTRDGLFPELEFVELAESKSSAAMEVDGMAELDLKPLPQVDRYETCCGLQM